MTDRLIIALAQLNPTVGAINANLAMARDAALFESLGLELDQLLCVGGGARNALWNQIKADVTQRPLTLADEPEAGIKGAALLGEACRGHDILYSTRILKKTGMRLSEGA